MMSAIHKFIRFSLPGLVVAGLWVTPGQAQDSYDLGVLEDRMKFVERDIGDLQRAVNGARAADTALRLDQLETELRKLTGKVEEMRFALDGMAREMKRFRQNTDDRLTLLEGGEPAARNDDLATQMPLTSDLDEAAELTSQSQQRAAATGTLGTLRKSSLPSDQTGAAQSSETAALPKTAALAPSGSEARSAFTAATGLMRKRQYAKAGSAFSKIIRRYPNDPLAAKAQYWLGQSFYFQGQYEEAANAYLDGYRNHPDGSTAPDSLLKLGMTLERLGQSDEACLTYQEVDSRYPKASATVKRRTASEKAKIGCR